MIKRGYREAKREYYSSVFPAQLLARLFTNNGACDLCDLELAFEWTTIADGKTIHKRYVKHETEQARAEYLRNVNRALYRGEKIPLMFSSSTSWRTYLVEKCPDSVHHGPVYPNVDREWERTHMDSMILASPLVFDLDMDDYDRSLLIHCKCKERQVCVLCWRAYMVSSVRILQYMLMCVFGFKKLLAVYSGRRGIHLYVFDKRVWSMNESARATIARLVSSTTMHTQHKPLVDDLNAHLARHFPSLDSTHAGSAVVLLQPKLDVRVTTDVRHLLRIPFSIHPATKKIAVPIALDAIDNFDPKYAPSVYSITHKTKDENSKEQITHYASILQELLVDDDR